MFRAGTYLLNVTWSGRLVKECPLKVVVEPPSNASKVICSGDGLRAGTLGKEIKCYIDTRSAGQDELTIKCEGPHGKKALSELNDHRDGRFTLYIRPQVLLLCYKKVSRYLLIKSVRKQNFFYYRFLKILGKGRNKIYYI